MAASDNEGAKTRRFNNCTIEFGDKRNSQILVRTFMEKMRGDFSLSKLVGEHGSRPIGQLMGSMPAIPGVRMMIDFNRQRVRIYDPLDDDPELVKRVQNVMQNAGLVGTEIKPKEESTRECDNDQFVTLLLELKRLEEQGKLRCRDGKLPTEKEIAERFPKGERLYDPGNTNPDKPDYAKDAKNWRREMASRR